MTYFAAVQKDTHIVFGLGMSKSEAMQDAVEWADDMDSIAAFECTSALYEQVKSDDGSNKYAELMSGLLGTAEEAKNEGSSN